jgi:hypothetical protein
MKSVALPLYLHLRLVPLHLNFRAFAFSLLYLLAPLATVRSLSGSYRTDPGVRNAAAQFYCFLRPLSDECEPRFLLFVCLRTNFFCASTEVPSLIYGAAAVPTTTTLVTVVLLNADGGGNGGTDF